MTDEYSVKGGWRSAVDDIKELATALAKAQGAIEAAKKDEKNPHFNKAYADLASCWAACREQLSKNGLSVVQLPCEAPQGSIGLITHLLHSSGQSISERFYMPVKDAMNPQAVGSALTYARRYALMACVGIAPEEDDGNAAKATGPAAPAPKTPAKDTNHAQLLADGKARLTGCKTPAQARELYSLVRGSALSEPAKTSLLSEIETTVKALVAKESK